MHHNNYHSNIRDCWSQVIQNKYNFNMKKFEMLQECGTDMKWGNAVGKMVLTDFPSAGLPHTLNSWKIQNLQGAMEWSTIKQGRHVTIPTHGGAGCVIPLCAQDGGRWTYLVNSTNEHHPFAVGIPTWRTWVLIKLFPRPSSFWVIFKECLA